jgi:tRNA G46 methylase TrmB
METTYPDQSRQNYQKRRKEHWEAFAQKKDHWHGWGNTYHHRLQEIYGFLIPAGCKVLEIGCGQGDLLASRDLLRGLALTFQRK